MAKRAAKRARTADPSAPASTSSTAGLSSAEAAELEASGSGEGVNHFARLPDELVRRILSELEATEAYETCQLWSLDRRNSMEHYMACIDAACAITELLAALSVASFPLEDVLFVSMLWWLWPSEAKQRQLGIARPQSLAHVAGAFLSALQPAPLRSLEVEDGALFTALLDAAALAPGCLPHLRELIASRSFVSTAKQTSELVEIWPNLKSVSWSVRYGAALKELSRLPLEELRVSVEILDEEEHAELEEALEALSADSVRSLRLPLSGSCEPSQPISPRALASILRFRNLEELYVAVDHSCVDALAGLGALPKLRSLELHIVIAGAPNGGAALLQAAAGALAAAPRLESLDLDVNVTGVDPDFSNLAALIRVARPTLKRLYLRGKLGSAELLREVARTNPKLETVLSHYAARVTSLVELRAFSELLSMPNADGRLDVRILRLPKVLQRQALSMFRGWFKRSLIEVHVNSHTI
eukprot:tig00000215_g18650.t1